LIPFAINHQLKTGSERQRCERTLNLACALYLGISVATLVTQERRDDDLLEVWNCSQEQPRDTLDRKFSHSQTLMWPTDLLVTPHTQTLNLLHVPFLTLLAFSRLLGIQPSIIVGDLWQGIGTSGNVAQRREKIRSVGHSRLGSQFIALETFECVVERYDKIRHLGIEFGFFTVSIDRTAVKRKLLFEHHEKVGCGVEADAKRSGEEGDLPFDVAGQ
jgi:hypothetical protein